MMCDMSLIAEKARRSDIKLNPPIAPATVELFEQQAGVSLPEDYRDFLIKVANGGRMPCMLVPLEHWNALYWIEDPEPSILAQPCTLKPGYGEMGKQWLEHAGGSDWEQRWDSNQWDPMSGTLAIAEIGCGLFYSLIVTGPYRGRIFSWGDHIHNPPIFCHEDSFGPWINSAFDQAIKGGPAWILNRRYE